MQVLIADKFPQPGQDALRDLGCEITFNPDLGADDLPDALKQSGAKVLIVRSTKVTQAAFEATDALQLVIRAGAGVNTIDLEAATRRGVSVANCPGKNSIAVAELAMGLILAVDRHIPDAVAELRSGHWNKKKYGKARGLFGRTLGLVGLGAIAQEVAIRASAFGMKVQSFSIPFEDDVAQRLGVARCQSLDDLLKTSDVISVHVPYGEATHHLIGAEQIAAMKDGATLIHTARGGVVDDAALAAAVRAGKINAGIDVYEDEPAAGDAPFESEMRELDGLVGTPHIGASTDQAQSAVAEETVRIVRDFVKENVVRNAVNEVAGR